MKKLVLSLGGSVIAPDDVDYKFLKKFKKTILKFTKKYKFIIVCGGGKTARRYIYSLKKLKKDEKTQSIIGIEVTRLNARLLMHIFGTQANNHLPFNMKQVNNLLKKNNIVLCGGLRYANDETSDSTSAKLSSYFKTDFINITAVDGLFNKDPNKHKNAKLIQSISWNDFYKLANKTEFKPGQHFILDQNASKIIMENRIKTHIIGPSMRNFKRLLNNKSFRGTTIYG